MSKLTDSFQIAEIISKEQFSSLNNEEKVLLEEWLNSSVENKNLYHSVKQSQNIQSKRRSYSKYNVENNWAMFIDKRSEKVYHLRGLLKYAAIFIILLGIGWYFIAKIQDDKGYTHIKNLAELSTMPDNLNSGYLILSDGEQVFLKEDNSSIQHSHNSNLVFVNGDTIDVLGKSQHASPELAFNQLLVPFGKTSHLTLSDGTKIWLNAGSKLVYPEAFVGKKREVYLDGEAFFDVERNPSKPFVVNTSDLKIKVLGTSFNVSAYPEDKKISAVLVTGKIGLSKPGKILTRGVEVLPNQRVMLEKISASIVVDTVNVNYFTSWKDGKLLFYRENVASLFTKLERYYNVQISMSDPDLKDYQITGKLNLQDNLENVCKVICNIIPVEYTIEENKIIFDFKEDVK